MTALPSLRAVPLLVTAGEPDAAVHTLSIPGGNSLSAYQERGSEKEKKTQKT
jgi:hypothetical protein